MGLKKLRIVEIMMKCWRWNQMCLKNVYAALYAPTGGIGVSV